jgi:hypothetical protein
MSNIGEKIKDNPNKDPGDSTYVPKKWNRGIRLIFSYQDTKVDLISQQDVEMIIPPSKDVNYDRDQSGFWYDLHDKDGKILYHNYVFNPIQTSVETLSDNKDGSFKRIPIEHPKGVFTLLIPQINEAQKLILYSSPIEPQHEFKKAKEIAHFDLRKEYNNREEE